jgi:hypothetical protein
MQMPLFYFDLHEGGELRDEEGSECADLEAACDLAVMYARDIAAEQVRKGHLNFESAIVVRDELGEIQATVTFGEALMVEGLTNRTPLLLPVLSLVPIAAFLASTGVV